MGISLRDIGYALAEGTKTFMGSYQQEQAQKREEERRLRLEEEDKRRWEAKRADAELRNRQIRMQMMMDKTKMKQQQFVNSLSSSDFDPETTANAMTKFFPDGRAYIFDRAATMEARKAEGATGEEVIFNVGTYDTNPDGTRKLGEDGKPIFNPGPGPFNQMSWKHRSDFVDDMARRANPQTMFAYQQQEMDEKKARKNMELALELKQKTGETAKTKAMTQKYQEEAELAKARRTQPGQFRQQTAATATVDKVEGIDGKVIEMTSQKVNMAKEAAKSLGGRFEGITPEEAVRMEQMTRMGVEGSKTTGQQDVRAIAKDVAQELYSLEQAAEIVADTYKLSTATAKALLREEMEGQPEKSFWNKLFK